MGNSATKEQGAGRNAGRHASRENIGALDDHVESDSRPPVPQQSFYSSRNGRGSRPDISALLGIGSSSDRDASGLESRRETKQEREARKLEKERVARVKERERSMREEHVDGGYLVTQGVYTGPEDFSKAIVRQLMIERRIAPFWRGLNDHSDSWTEHQLVAVARGRPLPAPDEIPEEEATETPSATQNAPSTQEASTNIETLMVPISSRAQSFTSEASSNASPTLAQFPPVAAGSPPPPSSSLGSALSRGRAKTLASLTEASKHSQSEMRPREIHLPKDPNVNGQPVEAYLYKDAGECPICFLFYPKYLNRTRCCDQAICTECFVQIKRPDPHPPEHNSESDLPIPDESRTPSTIGDELVSEPAQCPYCNQPEFGITYEPPPFRRGLAYANQISLHPLNAATSAMSSSSSIASGQSSGDRFSSLNIPHRRTISISAADPLVITTDRVRPDWHQRLIAARAHTARRSATATALHTAAYLMGNRGQEGDNRPFGAFGRRGILRRASGPDSPSNAHNSAQLNMLAMMSERYAAQNSPRGSHGALAEGDPTVDHTARGGSRRRRVEDLEEMMMMEAIRLSLASEEERRKREDKEAKKEAKKKDKENRKAEKVAKKIGSAANLSNESDSNFVDAQGDPTLISSSTGSSKGKSIEQGAPHQSVLGKSPSVARPQTHLERARQQILPNEPTISSASTPYRPSHLRTLSNASSSTSSIADSNHGSVPIDQQDHASSLDASPHESNANISGAANSQDDYLSSNPSAGTANESLFNFRSLAAMVGEDGISRENVVQDAQDGPYGSDSQGRKLSSFMENKQATAHSDVNHSIPTIAESGSRVHEAENPQSIG